MKYIKMLGLAAIAAAALMAWVGAGTASAATLTSPSCVGAHCAIGTVIHAENEGHVTLHPPIGAITCKTSTVEGVTTTTGGGVPTQTVQGNVTALSFSDHAKNCNDGEAVVTVLQKGTLEIHSLGGGVATLTSSGTIVTIVYKGFHCIFSTNNTDIGKVTDSNVTKSTATFDIEATIPRTGGTSGIFCGTTAQWTGFYKITKPDPLFID